MPKQRFGLGRGLDALIPGADSVAVSTVAADVPLDTGLAHSAVYEIPVAAISPNPQQPRMPIENDGQLLELAASIEEYGLLQPVLVTIIPGTEESGMRYQLIAGERRWRAAQIAGLERVPAVVRDATPQIMLEIALIENLQRADLNPLEVAYGYQMLLEEYHLTQDQVAERVGRDRSTISNALRLLQLPQEVRDMLIRAPGIFTEGHARAVLQVDGHEQRIAFMQQIIAQEMSVRQAEEAARRYKAAALRLTPDRRGARVRPQSYETKALEDEFMNALELKARLQRSTKGKGSLTLFFSNDEQLQRIYSIIVGKNGTSGNTAGMDALSGSYDLDDLDSIIDGGSRHNGY